MRSMKEFELLMKLSDADQMARAIDTLVDRNALDARSLPADARLCYGTPHEYAFSGESMKQHVLSAKARDEKIAALRKALEEILWSYQDLEKTARQRGELIKPHRAKHADEIARKVLEDTK